MEFGGTDVQGRSKMELWRCGGLGWGNALRSLFTIGEFLSKGLKGKSIGLDEDGKTVGSIIFLKKWPCGSVDVGYRDFTHLGEYEKSFVGGLRGGSRRLPAALCLGVVFPQGV